MAGRKAEGNQLASGAFHVLRGSTIVQNNEDVHALKKMAAEFQPEFNLLLRAFHISRARCLSVDLKEYTICGVNKMDAAALHCGVCHG